MTEAIGWKIGKVFLGVKKVIIPQMGSKEGRHFKILAEVSLEGPLLRGTTILINGSRRWVELRYERCQIFAIIVGESYRAFDKKCPLESQSI